MAVYKVIQDVEAEDKLVGFLGLRQLIYIMAAGAMLFVDFKIMSSGGPMSLRLGLALVLFLPSLILILLAIPLGGSQPTEDWVLARLNFYLNNQSRVWNQSGVKDLVTITVPKKIERPLTKNLSQHEVRSRLNALASTLDSRGWAVKNINVNLYSQPGYFNNQDQSSDRLVAASNLPQSVPTIEVRAEDDILDEHSSTVAQHFENLMQQQQNQHKAEIQDQLDQARQAPPDSVQGDKPPAPKPDFWFMADPLPDKKSSLPLPGPIGGFGSDPNLSKFEHGHSITPGADTGEPAGNYRATKDEADFLTDLEQKREQDYHKGSNSHLKTINPLHGRGAHEHDKNSHPDGSKNDAQQVTEAGKTAIVKLANESDSLRVSTVASLAKHQLEQGKTGDNEVEIRLH